MPWEVVVTRVAKKDLARLPADVRRDVERALDELAADPGGADLKKLKGRRSRWRLRVREWRVTLLFESSRGIIYAESVDPRGGAYRD